MGGGRENPPETLLPGTVGGRQLHVEEAFLRLSGVGVPTCPSEVGEG